MYWLSFDSGFFCGVIPKVRAFTSGPRDFPEK